MAVLRTPRLCSEFHKACKKKLDQDGNTKAEYEAFKYLTASIGENTEKNFTENFLDDIENKYP